MEESKVESPKAGSRTLFVNAVTGKTKFWLGAILIVALVIGVSIVISILLGWFGASDSATRNTLSVWYWVSILGLVPLFLYNQFKKRRKTLEAS